MSPPCRCRSSLCARRTFSFRKIRTHVVGVDPRQAGGEVEERRPRRKRNGDAHFFVFFVFSLTTLLFLGPSRSSTGQGRVKTGVRIHVSLQTICGNPPPCRVGGWGGWGVAVFAASLWKGRKGFPLGRDETKNIKNKTVFSPPLPPSLLFSAVGHQTIYIEPIGGTHHLQPLKRCYVVPIRTGIL